MILILIAICLMGLTSNTPVIYTWSDQIETGSQTLDPTALVSLLTFTVTFVTPKDDINYQSALALTTFHHKFYAFSGPDGRYSIIVKESNLKTITGMNVSLATQIPNQITACAIRYLVIEQSFSFMRVEHLQQNYSGPPQTYSNLKELDLYVNTNYTLLSSDYLLQALTAFDIQDNVDGTEFISLRVACNYLTLNSIRCKLDARHFKMFKIWFVGVDLLVYKQQAMNITYPGGILPKINQEVTNYANVPLPMSLPDTLLFYGIRRFQRDYNGSPHPMGYYITNSNTTIDVLFALSPTQIRLRGICFYSEITCPVSEYWNSTIVACSSCEDIENNCTQCISTTCFACDTTFALVMNQCETCSSLHVGCQQCNVTVCTSCISPYIINSTYCFLCEEVWANCSLCDTMACLSCTNPYVLNGTEICFLCQQAWDNCSQCSSSACLNCTAPYILNGTDSCLQCWQKWENCQNCSVLACDSCFSLYRLNGTNYCEPDCRIVDNCTTCLVISSQLTCDTCDDGLIVIDNQCVPFCGDRIVVTSAGQQCDDGNIMDMDGCSSTCNIQEHFQCNSTSDPSVCQLVEMNISTVALVKSEGKNQVVLTLELSPKGVKQYQNADWVMAFAGFSHDMSAIQATYDPDTNRLRITLAYNQDIQGKAVSLQTDFFQASSSFNFSLISLSLPTSTSNNQALYTYSDTEYMLATAVKYLSMGTAAISLILLLGGYFGCNAVIQVTALLLITLENTGPTFEALLSLPYSLGITSLSSDKYYYQNTVLPTHLSSILKANNSINLINIFLILFIIPMIVAIVLKVVLTTVFKDNHTLEKAWKYTLGTYSYYGILFLAYGECACFALSLRYFNNQMSCYVGLAIGVMFVTVLTVWVIASTKYPVWFGCFKNKFRKYQLASYFYLFSSIQRLLTAMIIVCLSPGIISAVVVCLFFAAEGVFLAINQPYVLKQWKRPLFNKVSAMSISLLYVGATLTSADSLINFLIPLAILVILIIVVVVAVVASIFELRQFWETKKERAIVEKKGGPTMSVEEAQAKLMQEFEMKLIPEMSHSSQLWRPIQNDTSHVDKLNWENYPILSRIVLHGKIKNTDKGVNQRDESDQEVLAENKEKITIPLYDQI